MALAAFAVRLGEETRQMQVVCLADFVPADDDLRRIEALIDWGQVRRAAGPFYRPGGVGGPGVGPGGVGKLGAAWGVRGSIRRCWSSWRWCWRGGVAFDARDASGGRDGRVNPAVFGVRADRA